MHRKNRRTLLVVWSAAILVATLFPGNRIPDLKQLKNIDGFDLFVHGLLFLVWSMLILRALYNREQARKWRCQPIVIAIIAGMVFGAFTEFLQFLIPVNRQASWFDFMADSAGTFVGVAIWLLNPRGHQQKKSILQG